MLGLLLAACSQPKSLLTNFVSPIAIAGVTVTPPVVLPGQLTTISVFATATTGTAIQFHWTVPDGWTTVGVTDSNTLTLKAPDTFGTTATVALTADDGQGRSVSTTIAVSTATDSAPLATIAFNPADPHVGAPVVLTSTVSALGGQAVTYAWSLTAVPDGALATLTQTDGATSGLTPDLAGTYVIELTVTDTQGMVSLPAKAVLVVAYSAPTVVSVTASPPMAAPGGSITLQASAVTTDGYPPNYTWVLPAGWTAQEPSTTGTLVVVAPNIFGASATALVTVDDGHGLSASASVPLATGPDAAPEVQVTTNPTNPEVGSPVELTAEVSVSAGRAVTYAWVLRQSPNGSMAGMIGAGESLSKFTPDMPGVYVVRLVVTDDTGLSTTTNVTITVRGFAPPVIASLSASPSAVPPGGLIVVSASATSPTNDALHYTWALPQGWSAVGATDSASLILLAPTLFSNAGLVTVTVDEGHGVSTTASVVVRTTADTAPTVSISATPTRPVVATTVLLTSQAAAEAGQAVTYAWSLTLVPTGSAAALLDPTASSTTFVPDVAGDYTVRLVVTDAAGMSSVPSTLTVSASAFSPPLISSLAVSPEVVEPGGTVLVTSQVATTDGYPVHYAWTVPSGWITAGATNGPSLLVRAPATYGSTGQLLLTVDEGHGASSSQLVILRTTAATAPVVTVGSSPTDPRVGSPVTLTSHATVLGGQSITYAWTLAAAPDRSTATLTDATIATARFTPDLPGDYVASLIVKDASGLSSAPSTTTITVTGFTAPLIADLTATPQTIAPRGLIAVSAAVTSTDGFPLHYVWSVPSGWTIVGPSDSESIIVTAPATYGASGRITLTVDEGHGATASASTLVATTPDTPPEVNITVAPTNPVIGAEVALTAQVTTLGGQTATYRWTLTAKPAGSAASLGSATLATTTFTPDVQGTYSVQLVATDASGLSTTASSAVSVGGYSAPSIQSVTAAPPTAPPGGAITLVAAVDSTDGFPLHYTWTIPAGWTAVTATDGNSIGLKAPARFGDSSLVLLTVDEGHGASASSSVIVATTADEAPTVSLSSSPTNPVIGARVDLSAHASVTGGQTVTYAWSLVSRPTGSIATIAAAGPATTAFTPDVAGTYVASVIVTDASGFSSLPANATIQVSGFLPPIIQSVTATPTVVTPGGLVSIAANITSADGYPVHYTWTIPTRWTAASATTGAALVLTAPALYGKSDSLLLTVDDGHGASTSTSVLLSTTPDVAPVASITASPSNPFAGTEVALTGHATVTGNQVVTYAWTLLAVPTGSTSVLSGTTGATVRFTPDIPGNYLVQVIATDASGLSSVPAISALAVSTFTAPNIASITVTPSPVVPGGLVSVSADAQTTDAFGLHYVWTIPAGWTPLGPVDGAVLVLTAPATFGTQDQILLTVDEGHGASTTSSAILETMADTPPVVTLTVNPSNPIVGTDVTVQSQVTTTANQSVTYAWTLLATPLDSTTTLTTTTDSSITFTPDLIGDYVVQLIVTDEAGTPSAPAIATITASFPAPIAVIAGPPPITGVINAPIKLDGSGSSNPAGNALSFTWGFLGLPPGSTCSSSCFTQGAGLGLANMTTAIAGLYSVQLTVKDVVTGLSATATTTVNVGGATQILIVSGNSQSAVVKTGMLDPAVVRVVAADGVTPIPNLGLTLLGGNLTTTPTTTTTDANGRASMLVVAGRIAGPSKLTVYVTSVPTISKVLNFTSTADGANAIALQASTGSVDASTPLTVTLVDKFGNPATFNGGGPDVANSTVGLVVESPSGLATFSTTASRGSISTISTVPPRATVTLSNGQFVGAILDPVVETVIVSIVPGPDGALRPLTSWANLLLDDAEGAGGKMSSVPNPVDYPATFRNDGNTGTKVWRLFLPSGTLAAQGQTDMTSFFPIVPTTGSLMTMLSFKSKIDSATDFDSLGKCWAQPFFRLRLGTLLTPVDGYDVLSGCGTSNTAPFLGPTGGAVTETVDLTDALVPPYTTKLSFETKVIPDANLPPPSLDSTWTVDDIAVRSLGSPTFTGAQTTAVVTAGAPKALTLVAAPHVQTVTGAPAPYTVLVEVLDANGNLAVQTGFVEVDWSGATGLVSILNPPEAVNRLLPSGAILSVAGKVLLQVTDSAADTLTFTASSPMGYPQLTNLSTPIDVAPPSYHSHSTGRGGSWQDTAATGTLTPVQALTACNTNYPAGSCVLGTNYAYPTSPTSLACSSFVWVFSAFTTTATSCAAAATIPAGRVATATPYSAATSACACGPMGETRNIAFSGTATWN